MNATYEHPSLKMHVTPDQRDRAESWLKEAYSDGRISEDEFDRRIGQVLSAVSRKDLNDAFYGLVSVPMTSQALGVHPAYQPLVRPETRQQAGRGVAAFAHFSAFFLWLLGPALVYALSTPGTYARKEAAKAFNFQVVSSVGLAGVAIVGGITGADWIGGLFALAFLGWIVLTVVGGAKALQGEEWRNPVKAVVKLEVLPEK
ncbi:MAG TPA: DUF1707 and DUF4870 domain-containing protein [Propionibacteriaceae bacterium]